MSILWIILIILLVLLLLGGFGYSRRCREHRGGRAGTDRVPPDAAPLRGLLGSSSAASQPSTSRAQRRPSSIAHTISDWPRRASPAAKTPSADVA